MRIAVEDLEALKELNDELEENHIETEKQLQEEIGQYLLQESVRGARGICSLNISLVVFVLSLRSGRCQILRREEASRRATRNRDRSSVNDRSVQRSCHQPPDVSQVAYFSNNSSPD